MKLKTEYDIEDTVYIKNDPDQLPHTVVGIIIEPGAVLYRLSYLGDKCTLYNFELSKEKTLFPDVDE
ncbi:MAG TPA: hypothetical protein PKV73_00970 [Agriterribacter sp.]|nr:hypothetical protein [Agriterribacter sp.]